MDYVKIPYSNPRAVLMVQLGVCSQILFVPTVPISFNQLLGILVVGIQVPGRHPRILEHIGLIVDDSQLLHLVIDVIISNQEL